MKLSETALLSQLPPRCHTGLTAGPGTKQHIGSVLENLQHTSQDVRPPHELNLTLSRQAMPVNDVDG